jgi:flotillin
MRVYHTAGPNEVMIITGGRSRTITTEDGQKKQVAYRISIGGGALVIPWLESVSILPLDVYTVHLEVKKVFTANSVLISVEGQAQVKVKGDEGSIYLAAEHFLGKGGEAIQMVAKEVIEGYMRAVLGARTIEEIIVEQESMSGQVVANASKDLGRMGLIVLSFSFKEITDEQGFISALAEPRIAQVRRDALIATAEAEKDALVKTALLKQEGDITKLQSEADVLEATARFEVKRAAQQAQVNEERAKADVAYDLERYKLSQELKVREADVQLVEKRKAIEIQEQEILRRDKELEASVKRPADAHSYQARIEADIDAYRKELDGKGQAALIRARGEAEANTIQLKGEAEAKALAAKAEGYRNYNQVALAEMFVRILPEVARAVSEPLSKVERIVLVGGGGDVGVSKLTGQVAQVVAQVPAVVESLTGINLGRLLEGFGERVGMRRAVTAAADPVAALPEEK